MTKITLFGGKGGVGKTTCSASFALSRAKAGEKTLIVSTDPAHSTADIFGQEIGDQIIEIRENLYALEINSEEECAKYMRRSKSDLREILSPVIVKELDKQIDAAAVSPGTEEAALFDKMTEIMVDHYDDYDKIIFDTAPTGHTVRLLSLPQLLGAWLDTLIAKRRKALSIMNMAEKVKRNNVNHVKDDPVIEILTNRLNKINKVRDIITDKEKVGFSVVLNAEKLPIEETSKAIAQLEQYGINVGNVVVNRVLPDDLVDEFWKEKKEDEKKYLEEIHTRFKDYRITHIPMLKRDMGPDNLDMIAEFWNESQN